MKKVNWKQLLGTLLMLALGGAAGFFGAHWAMNYSGGALRLYPLTLAAALIGFYLAYMLQIIAHEAGHLLAGLMTGYRFVSFRIGSVMWEKGADGHIHRSRFSLAGTGGQCLLAPPDMAEGRFPYVLYNLGGCGMNLLLGAAFAGAALLLPEDSLLAPFCWSMALFGLLLALMNGIPLQIGGVDNDGRNTISVSRSEAARRAFWLQMKINEQQSLGVRLQDMPEEWFSPAPESERANAMVSAIDVMAQSRLMDAQDFPAAEAAAKALLARKRGVLGLYRSLIAIDLAYLELVAGRSGEWVEALSSKETKRFMKLMKNYPTVLRTQYTAALLRDHNEAKAAELLRRFDRMAEKYPHPCEIQTERELMEVAACASRS